MRPQKILCPIDFSPCSQAALEHASELAESHDATLILAHVSPPPPTYISGQPGEGPLLTYKPEPDARLEKTKVPPHVHRVEQVHLVGEEGQAIVSYAERTGCDIIVMGTHGYGSFAKFFLGSVADYVLRHARSKVIVVRGERAATIPASTPMRAAVL